MRTPLSYRKIQKTHQQRNKLYDTGETHLAVTYCLECGRKTLVRFNRKQCDRCR